METVNSIRLENRSLLLTERKLKRTLELDRKRLVNTTSEASANVEDIANILKTKSFISREQLSTLKNCLLTEGNITAFMKIQGALRGIIRELTGSDSEKQMVAAECLCNLALSEPRSASVIAKVAGSYILPYLHNSLNPELAITCAWILGNLAGSHKRVCDIMIAQGAIETLNGVLIETKNEDIEQAVYYALIRFAHTLEDDLQPETCNSLLEILKSKSRNASFHHLVFILSCHDQFLSCETVSAEFLPFLLEDLSKCDINDSEQFNFIIKTLANICIVENNSNYALKYWENGKDNCKFETVLLNKINGLHSNILWLLGNIFTTCTSTIKNVQFFKTISEIIGKCTNSMVM